MKESKLVSIVIPVYNRETLVVEAIECALAQTYKDLEIIIVDNCSTDNTWDVINSFQDKRLSIYKNSTNLGPVLNWKKGIEKANGEFIKILFSDDYISPDYIEKSLANFKEDDAFVISSIKFVHNGIVTDTKQFNGYKHNSSEYINDKFLIPIHNFPVSPGAALFRKADLMQCFYNAIPNKQKLNSLKNGAGNDLLMFLLTLKKYPHFKTINTTHAFFRVHSTSFSCSEKLEHYYEWAKIYYLENNIKKNKIISDYLKFKYKKLISKDSKYLNEYLYLKYTSNFNFKKKIYFSLIFYTTHFLHLFRKVQLKVIHKIKRND